MNDIADWLPLLNSALMAVAAFLACLSWREIWDRIAARYVADLMPTIGSLEIDPAHIPQYLRWWGLSLVGVVLLFGFLQLWPLAVAAAYFVFIAPRLWLKSQINRRRVRLRDQLVVATQAFANTTRANLSVEAGLDSISAETPEPLRGVLRRIVNECQRGIPVSTAIRNAKERLQLDSFALFTAALLTSLERGGRITDVVERISHSLQENQRLERKMESETAGGRREILLLAVFPLLFLLLFLLIYPSGTLTLFTTIGGQVILFLVIGLVYVSVLWGQRILKAE